MPANLQTHWKRIGRSGKTIDGRTIAPKALEEAAANYNTSLYTALIWPEHFRWYNLGKITALRSESNSEGGIDLFAKISPNQYYQDAVKYGQKLFTSMELLPNFRDTKQHYLTGCAATDSPASAATSEMRFSASGDTALLLSEHSEFTAHHFTDETDDDKAPSWFTKLFKQNNEDDMDKQATEALQTGLADLTEQFKTLAKPAAPEDTAADKDETIELSTVVESLTALTERFSAFEKGLEKPDEENTNNLKFTALQTALDDLTAKFTAALEETPGTDGGEHIGDEDNNDDCL